MRNQQGIPSSRGARYSADATRTWEASAVVLASVLASPGLKFCTEGVITSGGLSLEIYTRASDLQLDCTLIE